MHHNQKEKLTAETFEGEQLLAHNNSQESYSMKSNFTARNGNGKIYASFVLTKENRKIELGLNGQNAKTLLTLIKSKHGLSTYEGYTCGLPRLSWYICVLRHDYKVSIITTREENIGGGWHGRYFLTDRVEVAKIFAANDSVGGDV